MRVAVIGLGYVGLPLAVAFARHFDTIGFDIDVLRISELAEGHDRTREIDSEALRSAALALTSDPNGCADAQIFVVTVPTPIDAARAPDLGAVLAATRTIGALLKPGANMIVVYESTVYPGLTEEVCAPLLEQVSGLVCGQDFFVGYSPERINPGDREHTIGRIVKVVAGQTPETTDRLAALYGKVTDAGVFRAASIKAAEAAKVIENTQRDINIAFMNEITRIFDRLDLSIWDVLAAARTKWNFLPFQPGLVGGHCIGVDPYYLSHRAQAVGLDPQMILAGRATNDDMARWLADRIHTLRDGRAGSVLILGLTFKEDVPDLRNSKVVDLVARLVALGHRVEVSDPLADAREAQREFGIVLDPAAVDGVYDIVVGAVPHAAYRALSAAAIATLLNDGGLLVDVKNLWPDLSIERGVRRWTF